MAFAASSGDSAGPASSRAGSTGASRSQSGSSGMAAGADAAGGAALAGWSSGSSSPGPRSSHVPWPTGSALRVRGRFAGRSDGVGLTAPF